MKTFPTLLYLLVVLAHTSYGQSHDTVIEYLNVPGPILFDNTSYHLIWSAHPAGNLYLQEYIAKGDIVTHYKTMISLDAITGDVDINDIVAKKVAELKKAKETNPVVNFKVFNNPQNGEYMLDFLISQNTPDGKYMSIVERNVYKYQPFADTSGRKGVVLFAVSIRGYGDDIMPFMKALNRSLPLKFVVLNHTCYDPLYLDPPPIHRPISGPGSKIHI